VALAWCAGFGLSHRLRSAGSTTAKPLLSAFMILPPAFHIRTPAPRHQRTAPADGGSCPEKEQMNEKKVRCGSPWLGVAASALVVASRCWVCWLSPSWFTYFNVTSSFTSIQHAFFSPQGCCVHFLDPLLDSFFCVSPYFTPHKELLLSLLVELSRWLLLIPIPNA
jgi:hypothetical protein